MKTVTKLIVFYLSDELKVKDVDREIYTEDKKRFHLFFFHNQNLDTKKADILKKVIIKEFENIKPEMVFNEKEKTLTMIKKIENVNHSKFDEIANLEFNKYTDNLNYRIKCIIQTFSLFAKLYEGKNSLFIIPFQLSDQFISEIEKNKIKYKILDRNNELVSYFDVVHWTNYYSRTETININKNIIKKKNIIKILEIIE